MNAQLACRLGLGLALVLTAVSNVHARIEAEALVGRPFGVGRITISGGEAAIDLNRVLIDGGGGRVFYPAVGTGVIGRLIGQVLGDPADRPSGAATVTSCSGVRNRWKSRSIHRRPSRSPFSPRGATSGRWTAC